MIHVAEHRNCEYMYEQVFRFRFRAVLLCYVLSPCHITSCNQNHDLWPLALISTSSIQSVATISV